ncbi:YggT family protein [Vulgatibacter incomptus]|uniref:YggT family protein n=1 Tax=Vulgatibacter incomptus TaxID=1391653 RepID=UPI000680F0B8|nr:YggT family protein [Vulgatibacter incomptus]
MNPETILLIARFLDLVSWLVILRVILSWVIRDPANPIARLLGTLTDPLLRPLSRVLTFGGLDLAPMAFLLVLGVIKRLLLEQA